MSFAYNMLSRRRLLEGGAAVLLAGGAAYVLHDNVRMQRNAVTDAKTLNRGNGAEPDTLDPHLATASWENNIIGDMFIGLMTEDAAGKPIFGAADSCVLSEDGLTYTMTLRDHTWSDGVKVTAPDYVYSFRRVLDPKTASQYASILYPIENAQAVNAGTLPPEALRIRALDDRTLQITCRFQVPYIGQLMTHFSTFAVPRHAIEKYGEDWLKPENIVTNGPYILTEWIPNDHIVLKKNPRFYDRDNVKIETVYYYPTPDASAALKRFRAGEFDLVTDSVPPQQTQWLKREIPSELRLHAYLSTQYVIFNHDRQPFDDHRVRTALSLAIDRETIAEKITRGGERPAYSLVPPHMPDYPGKAQLGFKSMTMAARKAKAVWLMEEAGFGPNNPLHFSYAIQTTTDVKIVAVALQEMWRQIGAQVRITQADSAVHYGLLRQREFDVAWTRWSADYADPKDFLFLLESSTKDLNFGDYDSREYDTLMQKSDMERNPHARAMLLQQAEQHMLDDMAIAPVFFGVTRNLVSNEVQGWIGNDMNVNHSRYLRLQRTRAET